MLKDSLEALIGFNQDSARRVAKLDSEVDKIYYLILRQTVHRSERSDNRRSVANSKTAQYSERQDASSSSLRMLEMPATTPAPNS